ncbi:MAG: hypothetical protein COA79_07975 [Planctomycetota bacterium]|nr:MAG: hypothetical protein COA79_07975 [Planctomycetota bacterium]
MKWNEYYLWLILISMVVLFCEMIRPWRKDQKLIRKNIVQDIFWLIFNGHVFGIFFAYFSNSLVLYFNEIVSSISITVPEQVELISKQSFLVQIVLFIVIKDFMEWNIHRLLHRNAFLWEFHKLHHSIVEMDWIGNMRFHWMEIIIYKSIVYLPLAFLGVSWEVLLVGAIASTLIGHLNHSNLKISWGPLRYLLNSPKMHIWHHDIVIHHTVGDHGRSGQNFGIIFSIWDWLFQTAYWPEGLEGPETIGFKDHEVFPENIFLRLIYPLFQKKK